MHPDGRLLDDDVGGVDGHNDPGDPDRESAGSSEKSGSAFGFVTAVPNMRLARSVDEKRGAADPYPRPRVMLRVQREDAARTDDQVVDVRAPGTDRDGMHGAPPR